VIPLHRRGVFLITNGALNTVDPALGDLPRADILVRDGRIEQISGAILPPAGAEVIAATEKIVMPGFVDTHYHMWSAQLVAQHAPPGRARTRSCERIENQGCAPGIPVATSTRCRRVSRSTSPTSIG
jgi:cytosine/adenosine deaminase-related metal-dependent hydrolase